MKSEQPDRITLTQISENRKEISHVVRKYRSKWGRDKVGRFLHFTGDPEPYQLFFRPLSALPPEPAAGTGGEGR